MSASGFFAAIFGDAFADSSLSDDDDGSDGDDVHDQDSESSGEILRYTPQDWTVKRTLRAPGAAPLDRLYVVGMPNSERFDRYICSADCSLMCELQQLCRFETAGPLHALHTEDNALYLLCRDPQMIALVAKSCVEEPALDPGTCGATATTDDAETAPMSVQIAIPSHAARTHNQFADAMPETQAKVFKRTHQDVAHSTAIDAHVTRSHAPERRRKLFMRDSSSSEDGPFLSHLAGSDASASSTSSSSSSSSSGGISSDGGSGGGGLLGYDGLEKGVGAYRMRRRRRHGLRSRSAAFGHRSSRNARRIRHDVLRLYADTHRCQLDEARAWFSKRFEKTEWFYVNGVAAQLIHHYAHATHSSA